jgi:cysteine synthase A
LTNADSVRAHDTVARRLAREEGIFCGVSSGCNMVAAVKLATRPRELSPIVVLACDTGQRYFSTALCGEAKRVAVPEREHPLDPRSRALLDRFRAGWEIIE